MTGTVKWCNRRLLLYWYKVGPIALMDDSEAAARKWRGVMVMTTCVFEMM